MPLQKKKLCFVIIPFSKTETRNKSAWNKIFAFIKNVVENWNRNYECKRSDAPRGDYINNIIHELYEADIVIADITDQNANVLYELGIRHALKNKSILITQNENEIPSDLKSIMVNIYDWKTINGKNIFKGKLLTQLNEIKNVDHKKKDNPVESYLINIPARDVWLLMHKSASDLDQRSSIDITIQMCLETLKDIHNGKIPILGEDAGHFNKFFEIIEENKQPEKIKVYANLANFERHTFDPFSLPTIVSDVYDKLQQKAKEGKIAVEHIFLLKSRKSLERDDVNKYLKEFLAFSTVKVAFEDTIRVEGRTIAHRFILLTEHRYAFAHERNYRGDISKAFLYKSETDYKTFEQRYSLIVPSSIPYDLK